jgi:hypothetical protein
MEDGIFYAHLVQFMVFCYILWTLCIVRGNLVHFFLFWYFVQRKIWQPWTYICMYIHTYIHTYIHIIWINGIMTLKLHTLNM